MWDNLKDFRRHKHCIGARRNELDGKHEINAQRLQWEQKFFIFPARRSPHSNNLSLHLPPTLTKALRCSNNISTHLHWRRCSFAFIIVNGMNFRIKMQKTFLRARGVHNVQRWCCCATPIDDDVYQLKSVLSRTELDDRSQVFLRRGEESESAGLTLVARAHYRNRTLWVLNLT